VGCLDSWQPSVRIGGKGHPQEATRINKIVGKRMTGDDGK